MLTAFIPPPLKPTVFCPVVEGFGYWEPGLTVIHSLSSFSTVTPGVGVVFPG